MPERNSGPGCVMCTAEVAHQSIQMAVDSDYRTPQEHVPALAGHRVVRQVDTFMVSKRCPQRGGACFNIVATLEDESAWLGSYHLNGGFVEAVGVGLELWAAARLIRTQLLRLCTSCLTISVSTPLRAQLHVVLETLWNAVREQAMQAHRCAISRAASAVATPFFSGSLWNLDHEAHYRRVLASAGVKPTDLEQQLGQIACPAFNAFSQSREVTFWMCHVHADCAGRASNQLKRARVTELHGSDVRQR